MASRKDPRSKRHNDAVRALLVARHPDWKGRLRLTRDSIGVRGLATAWWRLPLPATPQQEVDELLPELEWHLPK